MGKTLEKIFLPRGKTQNFLKKLKRHTVNGQQVDPNIGWLISECLLAVQIPDQVDLLVSQHVVKRSDHMCTNGDRGSEIMAGSSTHIYTMITHVA